MENLNPYAAPQSIDRLSSRPIMPQYLLICAVGVWLLFLISLILPGGRPDLGAWNSPNAKPIPGIICALFTPYFYPSNIFMVTLPVWLYAARRWRFARTTLQVYAVLMLLSGLGAVLLSKGLYSVASGYWVWVLSFFLAALTWGMLSSELNQQPPIDELTSQFRKK